MTRGGGTGYPRNVNVYYSGTAQRDVDYSLTGNIFGGGQDSNGVFAMVQIPAGQTSTVLTVSPIFDPTLEPSETVVLAAEGTTATAMIADEPAAAIAVTDATAAELGSDTTASFTVTRGGGTGYPRNVNVYYSGTAQRDVDYSLTGNIFGGGQDSNGVFVMVQIPVGQTSTVLTVSPIFDPTVEPSETVVLAAEATTATAMIADEPAVAIAVTDATAAELGPDSASFTVTRGGGTGYARIVNVFHSGTAQLNVDYALTGNVVGAGGDGNGFYAVVVIPEGQTSTTLTVTPIADSSAEPDETVILIAEGTAATATIADEPLDEP